MSLTKSLVAPQYLPLQVFLEQGIARHTLQNCHWQEPPSHPNFESLFSPPSSDDLILQLHRFRLRLADKLLPFLLNITYPNLRISQDLLPFHFRGRQALFRTLFEGSFPPAVTALRPLSAMHPVSPPTHHKLFHHLSLLHRSPPSFSSYQLLPREREGWGKTSTYFQYIKYL